jgi:hypothetical protein
MQSLVSLLEATAGDTLARGDRELKIGTQPGAGVIDFYKNDTGAIESGKKYFNTWVAALAVAKADNENNNPSQGNWKSSTQLPGMSPSETLDAWGHSFVFNQTKTRAWLLALARTRWHLLIVIL